MLLAEIIRRLMLALYDITLKKCVKLVLFEL